MCRRSAYPIMKDIAFPGTFVIDRRGRVTSRFFEDFYVERNTVSTLLVRAGDMDHRWRPRKSPAHVLI
jgi:hypothetical protein